MNRLSDERREEIVYRLLYGEDLLQIRGHLYKLINPTPKIRVLANRLYNDTIRINRFDTWLRDSECLSILVRNGLCTADIDNNLKEINTRIEDLKIALYLSMFDKERFDATRKELDAVKAKQTDMIMTRHMLDYLTLKGYAEMVKRQFLIFSTLYHYEPPTRVWKDWESVDYELMDLAIAESVSHIISLDDIREVSRTDPWKSFWNVSGGRPFDTSPSSMSEDQRAVILFSQMYENASKHPECPPDDVMDDDDLFDGWILSEQRKRVRDQNTKQMNDRLGSRHESADEVFVVARGKDEKSKLDDIKRIHSMNDVQAAITKKRREKKIKEMGHVVDAQFEDRRIQMQQEANQKFLERVKG